MSGLSTAVGNSEKNENGTRIYLVSPPRQLLISLRMEWVIRSSMSVYNKSKCKYPICVDLRHVQMHAQIPNEIFQLKFHVV